MRNAKQLADHIRKVKTDLITELLSVQSRHTTEDELSRTLDVLENFEDIKQFYTVQVDKISCFLPLNLPVYSLILFAIAPSPQTKELVAKVPTSMRPLFERLVEILEINIHFPNVKLYEGKREDFIDKHCRNSRVVIFCGRPKNFLTLKKELNRNTLLLYSGAGHNPFVIGPGANISLAAEKVIDTKIFNSGQDCAGADMIFIHSSIYSDFITELNKQLDRIPVVNEYRIENSKLCCGPLYENRDVIEAADSISKLLELGMSVNRGGVINFAKNIVHPTILTGKIKKHMNYKEQYSPLFPCVSYAEDVELRDYFEDKDGFYLQNEMYISLFGESDYIDNKKTSIVIVGKSIHDIERGNFEYGGYGHAASAWVFKGLSIYKPLFIPQEIYAAFKQDSFSVYIPKTKNFKQSQLFTTLLQKKTKEIFEDDLVFSFGYGAFAYFRDKRTDPIETLICLKRFDTKKISLFYDFIFEIHHFLGRIIDGVLPVNIVLSEKFESALEHQNESYQNLPASDLEILRAICSKKIGLDEESALQVNHDLLSHNDEKYEAITSILSDKRLIKHEPVETLAPFVNYKKKYRVFGSFKK